MEATPMDRPVVGLSLAAPRPQRRATVAFRIVLVFPHLLFLYVLQMLGMLVAVIAWFGAVFTGRIPEGIGDLLRNIVRYAVRVNAYLSLLTDQYPPFSLGATAYPVSVDLPPPTRLNRAAVLFRVVLAVPVLLVLALVGQGLLLPVLVIWLIVLVSGRMPQVPFEAAASYLRYQARFYAWFLMLTPEYPRGLFGDRPVPPVADASASSLPPPPPPPIVGRWGPPRITRLVLSRGAKRLLAGMMALGVVFLAGNIALVAVVASRTSEAQHRLDRDYGLILDATAAYRNDLQACRSSGGDLECLQTADHALSMHVATFIGQIERHRYPSVAVDEATDVRDDARDVAEVLLEMSTTPDPAARDRLAPRFETRWQRLDEDEALLHDLLRIFG